MPDKFIRPTLPYNADSLPNNNRYSVVAESNKSPGGDQLDADCNYLIDKLNALNAEIAGIVLGQIPGANDPNNVNKILTTTGLVISWKKIGNENLDLSCISSGNLQDSCIITSKLGDGSVTSEKIREGAVNNGTIEDDKISFDKITNENNAHFQQFFNSQNDNTLSGGKILDNTIPGTKILDNTLEGTKIVNNSITYQKLAAVIQIPIGIIMDWAGAGAAPSGWLKANGQSVTTAAYALLFAAIGYTFGGVGANFNVPDLRGRSIFGVDPASGEPTGARILTTTALAGTGGAEKHTLDLTETPSHTHQYNSWVAGGSPAGIGTSASSTTSTPQTDSAGGGLPHNNMPPYMLIQKIIYAGV